MSRSPLPVCAFDGACDAETARVLARDAELLAAKRRGATYWRAIDGEPSCGLERLALYLARFHVEALSLQDVAGVEWWVQTRGCDGSDGGGSILFHYDKDEVAYERLGVMRCPALSTATYLRADAGSAPLAIFDPQFAALATPAVGKHVAFDGAALHGVPAELGALFHDEVSLGGRRVSLLANLWDREPVGAHAADGALELGLSDARAAPLLTRAPAAFDDGGGQRRLRLSNDVYRDATPPLPLAGRGDRDRAARQRRGARAGLLVFRM